MAKKISIHKNGRQVLLKNNWKILGDYKKTAKKTAENKSNDKLTQRDISTFFLQYRGLLSITLKEKLQKITNLTVF